MADKTAIEWAESTWNLSTGCTKVGPECAHCYIERTPPFRTAGRRFENGHIPLVHHPSRLTVPLHWREPRRIFVDSLSDMWHRDVPDWLIWASFGIAAMTPQHTYLYLTKRPERMRRMLTEPMSFHAVAALMVAALTEATEEGAVDGELWRRVPKGLSWPLPNVWLGVSAGNQRMWRERVLQLRDTPAAVRWVSVEPILEDIVCPAVTGDLAARVVNWVVIGGESGPAEKVRETNLAHIDRLAAEAQHYGVPTFVKQLGAKPYRERLIDRIDQVSRGCRDHVKLKHPKGGDPEEWDAHLRVREYPI